jgi:hypothetical protein
MTITFEDAVKRATQDGVTDYARAWAIGERVARLYLVCTNAVNDARRMVYANWITTLPTPGSHHEFWDTVDQVRDFVVEQHEAGEICEDGSNDFLEYMGLAALEGRRDFEVTVTVTVTFRVADTRNDTDYIEEDVRKYLRIEVGGNVDDIDTDSSEICIDDVQVEQN